MQPLPASRKSGCFVLKACYGARMFRQRDIRRRFDRAAAGFEDAGFVHTVTRNGLVARLDPLVIEARTILDLGAGTGAAGRQLRHRFRRAHIVSLDLSDAMLRTARRKKSWLMRAGFVQADATRLPFAPGSFDLVVANQLLPWIAEPDALFAEVARVLRDGGVFAFATLGPDSLREIATAWTKAEIANTPRARSELAPTAHVNSFPDMHDVGDGLVRAGLRDPVLDVDRLEIRYEHTGKLFDDLTRIGGRNTLAARAPGLTGKLRFRRMLAALENATPGTGLSLDLELVYGHCWGGGPRKDPGSYSIAANNIPLRR
jgi:malonyl-CoA O-methyltransferase